MSSPEATEATLKQTPTNLAADAGFAAECAPRSPTVDKTADQSPQAGLAVAHEPNPSAAAPAPGADDYACLAEDDINWSTGYVKLCYMPDALNQGNMHASEYACNALSTGQRFLFLTTTYLTWKLCKSRRFTSRAFLPCGMNVAYKNV